MLLNLIKDFVGIDEEKIIILHTLEPLSQTYTYLKNEIQAIEQ